MDKKVHLKRGIGLSLALHGGGLTGAGEDRMGTKAQVEIDVNRDVISVHTSCTEMGQGVTTVLPMLAAEIFGVPLSKVECPLPDTSIVPDSGPTVASRTTMYVGKVVQDASKKLILKIKKYLEMSINANFSYDNGVFKSKNKDISLFEASLLYCEGNGNCSKILAEAVYEPVAGYSWD